MHRLPRFTWTELATTKPEQAKHFYAELFGWSCTDRGVTAEGASKTYTLCSLPQGNVAGIFELSQEEVRRGIAPHWGSYVSVTDVAAITQTVRGSSGPHAGRVIEGPLDIPGVGRMSVLQDPSGAVVRAWTAERPGALEHVPGAMAWNQLFTTDFPAAGEADSLRTNATTRFYASTFGWDVGSEGERRWFSAGGAAVGGLAPKPPQLAQVPSHWLVYLAVEGCEVATERAARLGARVLGPPAESRGLGLSSVIADPQGAVVALLQSRG